MYTKTKSKDVKLNSFLKDIIKVKLKAIDVEKGFYWILYSPRRKIRSLLIFLQLLSLVLLLTLSLLSSILYYLWPISFFIYSEPITLYRSRFFTFNHKSEPDFDICFSSSAIKILYQNFAAQLYSQLEISYDKPTSWLPNRWVFSHTLNPSPLVTNLISYKINRKQMFTHQSYCLSTISHTFIGRYLKILYYISRSEWSVSI